MPGGRALSLVLVLVPVLVCACAVPRPPERRLTIERIYSDPNLSGPLPSDMRWSPDSRLVTYLSGGALWAYDWETRTRERWLEKVESYSWSPAGDALLARNRDNIARFDPARREARNLLPAHGTRDATFSPDGRFVSFVRDHDLWVMPSAGGDARRLTHGGSETLLNGELDWVYPEELGLHTAHWWAPDSSMIAYLQLDESKVTRFPLVDWRPIGGRVEPMFYPKAGEANPVPRVGLVTLGGKAGWMALPPDTEYVARVGWTPGGELILQTLNRRQSKLIVTVGGRTVHTETHAAWVDVTDDLRVLPDGRLLCTSERSGRNHIYLDGRPLTSGDWDVAGIAGVGASIIYTSNEGRPLERHIWRVSFDGRRERLSREPGWHSAIVSPDGAKWIDSWSRADRPPVVDPIEPNPAAELAGLRLEPPQLLSAAAADGTPLDAMLFRPPGFSPSRRHPVIVHVYGGPGAQSVANRWNGRTHLWHQLLAERGFVVVVLDNRCSGARGPEAVKAMHRRLGELEVADLGAGVAWLMRQPWVDARRIGLWGWSYGGYVTCLAMTRLDVFRAGVAVAPVADWRDYDTIYTERYMLRPQDNPDGYRESAPVTHAAGLRGRLLIVHGLADDNVHFQNTVHLADALVKAGRPFEQLVYPGRDHGIADREARIHLFSAMTAFFERELR